MKKSLKKAISLILVFTMILPVLCSAVPGIVSAGTLSTTASADSNPIDNYVKDGLEALYVGSEYTENSDGTATWTDLAGSYDITGVTIDKDNYFTGTGYKRTSGANAFPNEILNIVQTGNNNQTDYFKSFTVEIFIDDFSAPESSQYQRFILGATNDRFAIYRENTETNKDSLVFKHQSGRIYVPNATALLKGGCLITITYNYDESTQKGDCSMYCNGALVGTANYGKNTASNRPFTQDLGFGDANSKYPYEATFKAIRFYNRAITAEEIGRNYATDLVVGTDDETYRKDLVNRSGYISDGLVSWYNGSRSKLRYHDTDATVWEDLVNGYNMTVANNDTNYFEEDGGYRLNGTKNFFPKEIVDVVNGDTYTIELKLSGYNAIPETSESGVANKYNIILSDSKESCSLFRKVSDNTLQFKYANNGSDRPTFNKASAMLDDVLISITYVAGDVCSVYINGKLERTMAAPSYMNVADLSIGHAGYARYIDIVYEQIRIYDRELSDKEIASNAAADGKIVYIEDGLEALYMGSNYTLDEGGATATWNDLMGKYDMTGVTIDENNYFADGGYRLTSAQNFFPAELLNVLQTKSPDATHVDGTIHKSYTVEMLVEDFVAADNVPYQRILASTNDRFCITRYTEGNILKFKQESERMSIDEGASNILEDALITITYDYDESTGIGLGIMYINGVMITSKSYAKDARENRPAPTDLFIGYPLNKASTYAYELTYKSMRFYGRALTADEITHNAQIDGVISRELLGYIEPLQPKTNVIGDVALTRSINSLAELNAMMAANALPAAAIYTIDENLNILDDYGNAFATFDEVLTMTDYSVLPMLIPVNSAASEAIVQYSTKTGFSDLTVLTSDKDLLKTTRQTKTNLRGALDLCDEYLSAGSLTHEDRVNIRKAAKAYMANFVVLPLSILTNDDLKHFYDMQVSVWAVCSDNPTDEECYKALLSGAMGIVTDDTARMLNIGCNEIPENTMVRVPMNIGHAGIPKIAPTDVLESFRLAVESGADCLEIDLQITADGEIVSIHDLDTIRTCTDPEDPEANYIVAETTFEKLRTLKANKGFEDDPRFENCYIPTLKEILDEFADTDVRFLFEMKRSDPSLGRRTVEYIHEYGIYDRSTIHSFFPDILAEARATDEAISLNYVRTNLLLDEIDSDYDMKGVMNLIGELNATYMLSIVNGSGVKSQRAAYLRGVQLYPYSFKNASAYANHYLWGYGGLTGDDARGLAEVVKLYTANADNTLTVGDTTKLTMTLTNYAKTVSTVSPSVIKIISGGELVSLNGNTLTALGTGEVTLALGYTGTVGDKAVNYFDDPITITITEKSSEVVEPSIKILASNLEYADFLHILYAVSVNAPEGATVSDVKMLFWDEGQIAYTKENAKIIKSAYTSTSITMGDVTYDNCSLIRSKDIAPKEICDDIYAVAYVTIDGVDYYSNVLRYSPLTYVYSRLYTLDNTTLVTEAEITTAKKQRDLYKTILKYGAAAQKIFGYTENGLATDDYVFVSVKGGKLDDGFMTDVLALGDTVTLIADDANSFVGWADEDGNILSTEATYTYTPIRSIIISAIYNK